MKIKTCWQCKGKRSYPPLTRALCKVCNGSGVVPHPNFLKIENDCLTTENNEIIDVEEFDFHCRVEEEATLNLVAPVSYVDFSCNATLMGYDDGEKIKEDVPVKIKAQKDGGNISILYSDIKVDFEDKDKYLVKLIGFGQDLDGPYATIYVEEK